MILVGELCNGYCILRQSARANLIARIVNGVAGDEAPGGGVVEAGAELMQAGVSVALVAPLTAEANWVFVTIAASILLLLSILLWLLESYSHSF